MMSASKIGLIVKKVFNKLKGSDEIEFNKLLNTDPLFTEDYYLVQNLTAYIGNEELIDYRKKLQNIQLDYNTSRNVGIRVFPFAQKWQYIASIAALLLIFVGSYYFSYQEVNTTALYEQYYNLDDVYLNTRSGNSTPSDLLEKGLMLFENDEYRESITYFEQLPQSVTALYYSGVAHMEINEYNIAIFKFDQVISDDLNIFYDQALWYKGLSLLKLQKSDEAESIFRKISTSDSYYSQKATKLVDNMK